MDGVKSALTTALWPCTFCSDPSGMLAVRYLCSAIAMRTAVPIDLYCYADFDYTVIAVCCNVLYKTHLIAYDGY